MAKYNMTNVPILYKDFDERVDRDYAEMRKRFDAEISKVEEEMARYRSELLDKEGKLLSSLLSPEKHSGIAEVGTNQKIRPVSPVTIQNDGKRKMMKIRFDVSEYSPNEVDVKADGKKLAVHAKYKQRIGNKTIYKETNREVPLPTGVDPDTIRPTIARNGILTVDAPLPNSRPPVSSRYYKKKPQKKQ